MGFEPQIRQIVEASNMPPKGERITGLIFHVFSQFCGQKFLIPLFYKNLRHYAAKMWKIVFHY